MELMLKAAALSVIGAALGLVLKKNTPEISLLLAITICCAILGLTSEVLKDVTAFMTSLTELTDIPSASVSAVLKATGIGIITRLSSDVCRDSDQNAAASAVELAGAAVVLFTALPLMETVLEMMKTLL